MGLCRGKNKNCVRRRLFQGFEQGVRGFLGEMVGLVNHEHLVLEFDGHEPDSLLEFPDLVYSPV